MGVMVSTDRLSSFFRRASFSMAVREIWSSAATVTVRTGAPSSRAFSSSRAREITFGGRPASLATSTP